MWRTSGVHLTAFSWLLSNISIFVMLWADADERAKRRFKSIAKQNQLEREVAARNDWKPGRLQSLVWLLLSLPGRCPRCSRRRGSERTNPSFAVGRRELLLSA